MVWIKSQFVVGLLILNFGLFNFPIFAYALDNNLTINSDLKIVKPLNSSTDLPVSNNEMTLNLIEKYEARLKVFPKDNSTRYSLAKEYIELGHKTKAKSQLLKIVEIEPTYYQAYHELGLLPISKDDLTRLLNKLLDQKALSHKNFTYYLALSELYEKDGQYYLAARALVDSSFADVIPTRYSHLLSSRIKLLLIKAKNAKSDQHIAPGDEDLDNLPPPIPDANLNNVNSRGNLLAPPNSHVNNVISN